MPRRTARKILTLATAIAASAGAAYADPKQPQPPSMWTGVRGTTATVIDGQPFLITLDHAPIQMSESEYGRFLGETQPLVGPDGRPGCGNIATKGDQCTPARVQAVAKRLAAAKTSKASALNDEQIEMTAKSRVARATDAVAAAKAKL